MKTSKVAVAACAFVVALATVGLVCAEEFRSPVLFTSDVNFDSSAVWKIGGTKVTATAADLNSGLASSTASLVSNQVLKVYGSNLVIKAGGTVELPDASIASADLPATISDSILVSNAVLKVYGSNLVIKAGGTVTVPAGSISEASIASLGLTTNIDVIVSGSLTNRLAFTNGLLKVVTVL